MVAITSAELDRFVSSSDEMGGANSAECQEYWRNFKYFPTALVDEGLDPYSDEYCRQQIALYEEVSGRTFDQSANEFTAFDVAGHVGAANPYASTNASSLVAHYLRLGHLVQRASLPDSPAILDMGAGWGLSSEFFATLGARVTAVDINPNFIELIAARQQRHRLPIRSELAAFDAFVTDETFDAVVFYECLHHSFKPWLLLERAARWLRDGGKLLFAGEPIFDQWQHWGIRLDPLSVYCIRKFGWFETGWSEAFIADCLRRAGLAASIHFVGVPEVGYLCVAPKIAMGAGNAVGKLPGLFPSDGWYLSEEFACSRGLAEMLIPMTFEGTVKLKIHNFRPSPICVSVAGTVAGGDRFALEPGETILDFEIPSGTRALKFKSDVWSPNVEVGTDDGRFISFHLSEVAFLPRAIAR